MFSKPIFSEEAKNIFLSIYLISGILLITVWPDSSEMMLYVFIIAIPLGCTNPYKWFETWLNDRQNK